MIDTHCYDVEVYPGGKRCPGGGFQQEQAAATGEQTQVTGESPLAAMPASDVIGTEVKNAEGETVAEIVEVLLTWEPGKPADATVATRLERQRERAEEAPA
mgnify:CR=1 FL=1